ncbi:MAG: signal peptidase II [Sphingomonadales bacterium 32-68-7]|nr:MAG: signal peptidase II [Bosea sp. 12-68-7]OYX07023.1 MAG: signal peptidase II [Sphingomonadales bacterium 32-68-7]
MTTQKRLGQVLGWTVAAAALDQLSKWLVLTYVMAPPRVIEIAPFLNLRLGFNYGVSFGIGRDTLEEWPGMLAAFKVAVALGLMMWAVRSQIRLERIGLALIAGGALGNAYDRWRQGAVADFIDLHWGDWHWPTFNGADIAISAGVGLMLVAVLADYRKARSEVPSEVKVAPDAQGDRP